MKNYSTFIPLMLLALSLSACGGDADVTPTEDVSISTVYTAAAMTLMAQAGSATPIFTLLPTLTPTIWASPTYIPSTPTSQSVSSYASSYPTANGCYDEAYVSDVMIADGSILAPGEEFVKTWELQNTGSCDWSEDFLITFSSGDDMDGDNTEIDEAVEAGDTAEISVSLIAPDDEGTYTGYWKLTTENGTVFGESVYVLIVVSDNAATSTPTTTEITTTTATATSTPGSTATGTSTTVPTSTYTPWPTNTYTSTPTPVPTEQDTSTPEIGS
jgi:hypothetical protein